MTPVPRSRSIYLSWTFAAVHASQNPVLATTASAIVAFTMDVYSHLLPTMQETASAAIEAALIFPRGR